MALKFIPATNPKPGERLLGKSRTGLDTGGTYVRPGRRNGLIVQVSTDASGRPELAWIDAATAKYMVIVPDDDDSPNQLSLFKESGPCP